MINVILLIILNSLIICGLYKSFQFELGQARHNLDGEIEKTIDNKTKSIFWFWKYYILDADWMPYRLSKPLGNCMICMASIYSFLPYWMYYRFDFTNFDALIFYPFYILALAGLNAIFDKFINE